MQRQTIVEKIIENEKLYQLHTLSVMNNIFFSQRIKIINILLLDFKNTERRQI
jgi:hypothetical protein